MLRAYCPKNKCQHIARWSDDFDMFVQDETCHTCGGKIEYYEVLCPLDIDLLEALRIVQNYYADGVDPDDDEETRIHNIINSAIARAEGRS